MWIIAGLGNPGPKYAGTRHNVGFDVVDALARRAGAPSFASKFKGEVTTGRVGGESCLFLKPLTFMNLSGDSVQPAMAFYKVAPANLIVVHDEIDLDLGVLKLKTGGGHGGHNGIRHIAGRIGPDFFRVRAGVGRPSGQKAVTSHVLGGFSNDEQIEVDLLLDKCADAIELIIQDGLTAAQAKFHEKKKTREKKKQKAAEPVDDAKAS